ncbi:hypothetical protein AMECASPLE_035050 [Ameca splendens]|uniref:Uncharacterized protein n=1 Tax=Ameca splendens TaxID=208324 RepID=A0ABV0XWB8_9TELE
MRERPRKRVDGRRERAGCCRLRDALTHQRVTAVTAVGTEHPLPGKRNKAVYCIIEGIQLSFILLSRIKPTFAGVPSHQEIDLAARKRTACCGYRQKLSAPWIAIMAPVLEDGAQPGITALLSFPPSVCCFSFEKHPTQDYGLKY